MPESLKAKIRAAISNAYYDERNAGGSMEGAADRAATDVMALISERFGDDDLEVTMFGDEAKGHSFYTLPDGTLMKRPAQAVLDANS